MRLEDMREQFPKMPESMKRMIEQEVAVQIGQEKENDNPKVVTYKKRNKKVRLYVRYIDKSGNITTKKTNGFYVTKK